MSRAKDEQKMLDLMSKPKAAPAAEKNFGLIEWTGLGLWLLVLAGASLFVAYRFVLTPLG